MKAKAKLFVIFLFLIAACSSPSTSLTPDFSATHLPTFDTIKEEPTKTQEPTSEPTPRPYIATIDALSNDCKVIRVEPSPNGQWYLMICNDYKIQNTDKASSTLKIINLETFHEWKISYYQVYGVREIETTGQMTDGIIFPVYWSGDGKYLFLGVVRQVYREYYYNRTAALFILNLETGEVNELLDAGKTQETFYDFSLSHDENRIAYVDLSGRPLELIILTPDANQLQTKELDSKFTSAGSIVWSQADDSLIFLAVNFSSNSVLSTLYKWDTQTGDLVELFQLPDMLGRLFFIVRWDEANNLIVLKNYHAEEFFNLDLSIGEISPVSP